ncbi:MAG TPA: hypothetical protein PKE19_00020 [Aestuariivirga sp.]|nr:hypothetical protein [Aestuariivirga sp.]
MTISTTLNRIRAHGPCVEGWKKLLAGLGKSVADDEPLPFSVILKINGINDTLWCCRAEPQRSKEWRLFAVWCARQLQHLMKDDRSIAALDVAARHAFGNATDDELAAAGDAAEAAAWAAARDVAWAAAWGAAGDAAEAAAREAQSAKFKEMVDADDPLSVFQHGGVR